MFTNSVCSATGLKLLSYDSWISFHVLVYSLCFREKCSQRANGYESYGSLHWRFHTRSKVLSTSLIGELLLTNGRSLLSIFMGIHLLCWLVIMARCFRWCLGGIDYLSLLQPFLTVSPLTSLLTLIEYGDSQLSRAIPLLPLNRAYAQSFSGSQPALPLVLLRPGTVMTNARVPTSGGFRFIESI